MSRILVVGASGQLATALAENSPSGSQLTCMGRDQLDLTRTDSIRGIVEEHNPSGVINASAYTAVDKAESEPDAAFALNRDGPAALAEACSQLGVPLVHVSTDYVFDGAKPEPYVESDDKAPLGVYGRSKSEGEDAILNSNARAAIIRTAWVYSAVGGNFVKTMLRLAAQGRDEVGVVADQHGRPTYAPDLANACLSVLTELENHNPDALGVFHYSASDDATWASFAEGVFECAAQRGLPSARVKHITSAEFPTPTRRPENSRLDNSRIETLPGVRTLPWRHSLNVCMDRIAAEAAAGSN